MTRTIVRTVGAALLVAGLAFGTAARAAEIVASVDDAVANANGAGAPHIVLAYGGCGPFGHRGPSDGCRPGGQWGGYISGLSCPAGFHIGPFGRRCWPNDAD